MRGKAKLVRKNDGLYHVYVRNHFWQPWKVLIGNNRKPIIFKNFQEFCKITKIECFDEIILKYNKYSGFREDI